MWATLAVAPKYREDWLLENLPTFVAVPVLVLGYRRFRFSDRAYIQGTAFLILHTIGAHYTYSEVPLGEWLHEVLDLSRNHYDRLVHFAFGFLVLRPVRELAFRRPGGVGRFAELYLSVTGVVLWSALYELLEWVVASIVDPAAGTAFLGTQGDPWDSQKDVAMALCGALFGALVEACLRTRASRAPTSGRHQP